MIAHQTFCPRLSPERILERGIEQMRRYRAPGEVVAGLVIELLKLDDAREEQEAQLSQPITNN